jgi:transcription elongation factor Elf1
VNCPDCGTELVVRTAWQDKALLDCMVCSTEWLSEEGKPGRIKLPKVGIE